jgi:hypothetical protein
MADQHRQRSSITLDEGEAIFDCPDELSAESVKDLEDWYALVLRRLKRRAEQAKPTEPAE